MLKLSRASRIKIGFKAGAYSGFYAGILMGLVMIILNHKNLILFPEIIYSYFSKNELYIITPIFSVFFGIVMGSIIGVLFPIFCRFLPGNIVNNSIMFCVLIWVAFLITLPAQVLILFPNTVLEQFWLEFSIFIIINLFVYIFTGWILGRNWTKFMKSELLPKPEDSSLIK